MAAQTAHHVVNSTQSVSAPSLADVPGNNSTPASLSAEAARADNPPDTSAPPAHSAGLNHARDATTSVPGLANDNSVPHEVHNDSSVNINGVHEAAGTNNSEADLDWRRRDSGSNPSGRLSSRDRSNSFKKPASFKAVSVTKNFLAKSATASPSPRLPLDSKASLSAAPSSPAPSMPKPRLVAKTGSNSRAATLSSTGSSGAPDASKVWNRNRPAPAPQPKQFTDEELKQQYGIHMATRLQADEPAKGSAWADMEDDEDDWAPDTVEWMDGTKSTLQPSEEQKLEAAMERASAEQVQNAIKNDEQHPPPTSDQDANTPSFGPGKTILRPGARASAVQTRPGLVLKNVPEPTAETPKQPTPGPTKSPWATLPPVDKVSPVNFNPPAAEVKPPPVSYRDYKPPPLPADFSPTREIAADTFERSWREHDRGSRELFDSKSGRYEPVRDKRRSSFRGEGNFRPPSVLQRPSHGHPSDSADSGSAHRMQFSQDARHWGRRRSSIAVEDEADHQKDLAHSPHSAAVSLSDQAPPSVTSSAPPQAYSAHGPDVGHQHGQQPGSGAGVHEMQQQLMRQRIEANRRRKEEEQAKEEAAKQERIRQKLLALGEPPIQTVTSSTDKPNVTAPSESMPEALPAAETPRKEPVLRPPPSAPLGPATHLDGLGEVPDTKKAISIAAPETAAARKPDALQGPQYTTARANPTSLPSVPAIKSISEPNESQQHPGLSHSKLLPESHRTFDRPQQQWSRTNGPIGAGPGWNSNTPNSAVKPSANVWGPPSKDKSLGNGAFDADMTRIPSINFPAQATQQTPQQPPPGPIAPPSASPKAAAQHSRSTEPSPPSVLGQSRMDWQSHPPGFGQRTGFAPVDPRQQTSHQPFFHQAQPPIGAQWNAYGPRDRHLADEERRQNHSPFESGLPQHNPLRPRPLAGEAAIGDRWSSPRGLPMQDGIGSTMSPPLLGPNVPQHQLQHLAPGAPIGNPRTSSRFFGTAPERTIAGHVAPVFAAPQATESQTGGVDSDLFGPDSSLHTYGRTEPLVKLPKPKPRVRLPSTPVGRLSEVERQAPNLAASRPPAYGGGLQLRPQMNRFSGQQPIVANAEWQNRFDMVTGRKSTTAPPLSPQASRGPAPMPARLHPVTTSSRPLIEMESSGNGATVSLPQQMKIKDRALYSEPSYLPFTKHSEDCLYDEPENGSRPVVAISKCLPSLAWSATVGTSQRKSQNAVRPLAILAGSAPEFRFDVFGKLAIKVLGMPAPTFRSLLKKNGYNPAGKGPRKTFQKKERTFERNENKPPNADKDSGEQSKRGPSRFKQSNNVAESASSTARDKKGWAKPPRGHKTFHKPEVQTSGSKS